MNITELGTSVHLARKLNAFVTLAEDDRQVLKRLPVMLKMLDAEHDIAREGEKPAQCCVILEGWACRSKMTHDGSRQIVALHLPGDIPDLQSLHVPVMDHTITTLTTLTAAFASHDSIHELLMRAPRLAAVFWRDTLVEAAITREWVVNMGQRSAQERIAHLLCEVFARLEAIGLTQEVAGSQTFPWPLTQFRLGEATGLSSVHVNRSLQELRATGLIKLSQKWVTILNWSGLQALAGFKPDYLSLTPRNGRHVGVAS